MPDTFTCQGRTSRRERINQTYLPISLSNNPRPAKTIPLLLMFIVYNVLLTDI